MQKSISKTIQSGLTKHRQKIGMVFQQFNLFANLTIIKNITNKKFPGCISSRGILFMPVNILLYILYM